MWIPIDLRRRTHEEECLQLTRLTCDLHEASLVLGSCDRKLTLAIETIDSPGKKPPPGEVLIRNRFVGICGTDLHEYAYGPIFIPVKPHPFTKAQAPQILGHEFGGVVEAIGVGVASVKAGDRVSVQPLIMPRVGDYYAERQAATSES